MLLETLTDSERGSSPWFYPKGDAFDEDYDEDREEVRGVRLLDAVHLTRRSSFPYKDLCIFHLRRGGESIPYSSMYVYNTVYTRMIHANKWKP